MIEKVTKLIKEFSDLEVYKLAYAVSLEIHKASLEFPKIEQFALASQIGRCSKSICANLAEGFAKQADSYPEFNRFISIAIGSSSEMQVWVQYALDLEYITPKQASAWQENYRSISRMLQKLRSKNQSSSYPIIQSSE